MKTIQNFAELFTGRDLLQDVKTLLMEQEEDFQKTHSRYLSAVKQLKAELGHARAAAVDEAVSAMHRRIASELVFSGFLGLKMNWEHFLNPMAPNCTWPQVDFHDYLQEHIARSLPVYPQTEKALSRFYASLTPGQQEIYSAITQYESHLLTAGPKLAHYYGYLLGDASLHRIIPGYRPDAALTLKYNTMLAEYFGKHFLPLSVQSVNPNSENR